MELGNAEAVKEMVSAGLGVSITSAVTVASEVPVFCAAEGGRGPPSELKR
jgi:hypothetical protein